MFTPSTIKKRSSCRTYQNVPIKENDLQKMRDFLLSNVRGPFGSTVRFELIDLMGKEQDEVKTLATYGIIKGASIFIVGAAVKGERTMEDYGYCMEKNILFATDLGLGTCWLGGAFNRGASSSKIKKRDNEVIPAITPLGYPMDKKSFKDNAIRFLAKSNKRKAWDELFFCGDAGTPLTQSMPAEYQTPLECVRIGPSASNKQPWRIVKEKENPVFHFYISRTPGYLEKYPEVSLQDVDMGIAMCHFDVAVQEMNRNGNWQTLPSAPPQQSLEYVVSWVGAVKP
jgi:hypothetical protein